MSDKLLKFAKQEEELETDLDRWLYVLKNMNDLKKIPVFLRKTIFERVFKIATYTNLTKEEKMLYDLDLKKQWDDYSALETAKNEGLREGIKEGIKEGKKAGLKEGERKKAIEAALKMKKSGLEPSFIADMIGLSIEEIEKL